MENVWNFIKAHPYAFGGAVGIVVLWIWWRSRSDTATQQQTQYPYDVYQDPNVIGAEANLAATQSQTNAQVQLGQAAITEQGTEAQLQAGVLGQYLTDQTQALQDQSNALLGIAQAQYGAATNITTIETQGAEQLAQINGQSALALQQNQNAANIQLAQINQPSNILATVTNADVANRSAQLGATAAIFGGDQLASALSQVGPYNAEELIQGLTTTLVGGDKTTFSSKASQWNSWGFGSAPTGAPTGSTFGFTAGVRDTTAVSGVPRAGARTLTIPGYGTISY